MNHTDAIQKYCPFAHGPCFGETCMAWETTLKDGERHEGWCREFGDQSPFVVEESHKAPAEQETLPEAIPLATTQKAPGPGERW